MRLIDADALIEEMKECAITRQDIYCNGYAKAFIDNAPTIEAEPVKHGKHGRWEMRGGKRYCTNCGVRACVTRDSEDFWYTVGTPYCPNCGAKMDLEG